MFAYTENSFRAIAAAGDAVPGEQVANVVPAATLRNIRSDDTRREIANRIRSTDWALCDDAVLDASDKAALLAYRSALRALTNHPQFPDMPWPEPPQASGIGSEAGEQS